MNKLFGITLLISCSIPALSQENISEAYFHELQGMEDSAGVTHLFYRMFTSENIRCTDMDGYTSNISKERNHIYHYDTSTLEDSVEFRAYNSISPGCFEEWNDTERFVFTDNHPDSTFAIKSTIGGLYGWYYFPVSDGHQFGLNIGNPLGVSFDEELNDLIITTPFRILMIKAKAFDEKHLGKSFRFSRGDSVWHSYENISDLPDSLFINFTVTGINPHKSGHYVGVNDSNFVQSTDFGKSSEILLKHSFEDWQIYDAKFGTTYFDADSNSFYLTNREKIYLVTQKSNQWSFKELSDGYQSYRFAPDAHKSGSFYYSNNDSLLYSEDYGESGSLITTFLHKITGLYKKPNSDILYVLTRKELLKVNVETKQTITLEHLPVSSEQSPDIPNQISLEQNYPNPFNPSTVISYQLNSKQLVRLEVFDVTGRKVAVLVDGERKSAGNHRVGFDGSGISSGVYFYRLETGGQTLTKKMLLVK
ncbi:MAG: T9SS type A sorting domain-containing protein [Balneolaceae bacterium]